MKTCQALSVVALVVLGSSIALAQDPVKAAPTHYKPLFENADVRILQVDYAAGSKSGMHQHPDSLVVSLTPSKVRFTTPDGKSQDSDMPADFGMYHAGGHAQLREYRDDGGEGGAGGVQDGGAGHQRPACLAPRDDDEGSGRGSPRNRLPDDG